MYARKRRRYLPALVLTLVLPALSSAVAGTNPAAARAEQCANPTTGRETDAVGSRFMVAAANPFAAQAGCKIIARGGTAADAAVAVQAVLAVVEPHASGLTGGTLINYWNPDKRTVRYFDGMSRAPKNVPQNLMTPTDQERKALGVDRFPYAASATARAFAVPGTLRVLSEVHDKYGDLPWDQLFDDAINLAANGFPMPEALSSGLDERFNGRKRCNYPDLRPRYCNGDKAKKPGTTIRNPEIAQVLREVRDGGADAFYDPNGTIAPAIVKHAAQGPVKLKGNTAGPVVIPSLMTVQDFADYAPIERKPLCRKVLGVFVCTSAPPAFGGVSVLEMLGLVERGQVGDSDPDSADRMHLFIEASRMANFDRRGYIGDPAYHPVPAPGLLDDKYLDQRFSLYSPDRAIDPITPGEPPKRIPPGPTGDVPSTIDVGDPTSNVSIVDGDGDAISMTTTINTHFGAHLEARGMILNNAMNNFTDTSSVSPGKPVNVMQSQKRPTASMAPTLVFDGDGRNLRLVVGAAGGSHIPDYVTQAVVGVVVDGMGPAEALDQGHFSGQDITRKCGGSVGAPSELEAGRRVSAIMAELVVRQHPCPRLIALESGLTAIEIRGGQLRGAADRRRDGSAVGR